MRADARIDFGWTLNSPGARHSVRLVFGALDGHAHRARDRRAAHRRRGERRLSAVSRRQARRSTTGASSRTARGSRTWRSTPGIDARHSPRVLREHRQRAREARVGRRRTRTTGARQIDSAVALARARATSRSSSPASRRASFAIARSSALPGHQEELIERVAATGKPVVVVLVGGSAITMSRWLDRRRRGGRRVVSGRGGRPRRRRRAVRRRQPGRPAADHVPDVGRAAAARLQSQADGPRRRLSRPHRAAAVPVRLRAELHDVRVFSDLAHRAGGDRAGRHGDGHAAA